VSVEAQRMFYNDLFETLGKMGINYCVLHSYAGIPHRIKGDLDMCIDRSGHNVIDKVLNEIAVKRGFVIVQKLYYDVPSCFYYVIAKLIRQNVVTIQLDFLYDNIGINRYHLTSKEFLKTRKKYKNFFILNPLLECTYILVKKIVKRTIHRADRIAVRNLCRDNCNEAVDLLIYFGKKRREMVRDLIWSDDVDATELLVKLRTPISRVNLSLFLWLQKVLFEIKRMYYRVVNPTGLSIAILSPDGGGKTTVAKELMKKLRQCFRRTDYMHWRPCLLPEMNSLIRSRVDRTSKSNLTNHVQQSQNYIKSSVRFLYYFLDFLIGHLKIKYLKIRTSFVVFDRYYYDYFFDPHRYNFRFQGLLYKFLLPLVPEPDLVFYLDCDPKTLFKRKKEICMEELERQVESARILKRVIPDCHIINNNDRSIRGVVSEITSIILKKKAAQTEKLLRIC